MLKSDCEFYCFNERASRVSPSNLLIGELLIIIIHERKSLKVKKGAALDNGEIYYVYINKTDIQHYIGNNIIKKR